MTGGATRKTIEAVWRIESARLIGGLVRVVEGSAEPSRVPLRRVSFRR